MRAARIRSKVAFAALGLALALAGGCAYLSEKQAELIFRPAKGVWRGYDPELLFFPDEGHGFAKLENRLLFAKRMVKFLHGTIGN